MSWRPETSSVGQPVPTPLANIADRQATALDEIAAMLDQTANELVETGNRLEQMALRSAGPTPEKSPSAQAGKEPMGMIGLIIDKIERLNQLSRWHRESISKLERVL